MYRHLLIPLLCVLASVLLCWVSGRSHRWRLVVLWSVTLLFPVLYWCWVWKYTVNVPSWDDFGAILGYLLRSPAERLGVLFCQHNEHRIVFTRLVVELSHVLLGSADMKAIALVGNFPVVGLFLLLAYQLRRESFLMAYLPAIAALVFMPLAWINMIWAMVSVQSNGVPFFALLSLMCFFSTHRLRYQLAAMGAGVCAVLTSASGLFVFPAILMTLALRELPIRPGQECARHERPLLKTVFPVLVSMVLVAGAYFANYTKPAGHPEILDSLAHPARIIHYGICFVGAIVPDPRLSVVAGFLVLMLFLVVTAWGGHRKNPALYAMVIYFFITAAAASLARSGFGVEQALDIRYRVNSLLLCAVLFVLSLQTFPRIFRHRVVHICVTAAVLLRYAWCVESATRELAARRESMVTETASWLAVKRGLHYPPERMAHAGMIFDRAVARGVYIPPKVVREAAEKMAEPTGP